jgi:hypothetical protein
MMVMPMVAKKEMNLELETACPTEINFRMVPETVGQRA